MAEEAMEPRQGASPRPRAAFLCSGDPLSLRTWSGTPYHMLQALSEQFEITRVVRRPWPAWFTFLRRGVKRLTGGAIDLYWAERLAGLAARGTVSQVLEAEADVIFAVAITPICAQLVASGKAVFVSDATQASMVNYNPHHRRLAGWLKRSAFRLESVCIQRSALCLFPSAWAAGSARRDHAGQSDRMLVVPWGANLGLRDPPSAAERLNQPWRLLFVGANWAGKGGDIALETVAELRRMGHAVRLDVVGSAPATPPNVEGVSFHGFLDKNAVGDRAKLNALFNAAHLFFLPTRFDALGIVFAEAASFGLPAVSYDTGGVPGMVVNGETGLLLPEGGSPHLFAEAISSLLSDPARYAKLSAAALERSRAHLNWRAWAAQVRRELVAKGLVAAGAGAPSLSCPDASWPQPAGNSSPVSC